MSPDARQPRERDPHVPPAVSLRGISKRFGDVVAVDEVSLEIPPGEVHALLGENGAGKTSLMNILAGLYRPDGGEIWLHGRRVEIHSPDDAKRLRIGMVHQEQRLVTRYTAPENISLGHREPRFLTLKRFFRGLAARLSRLYHLPIDAERAILELPLGQRQRVELVKLLHHGAEIIILDEPTGNLGPAEVETFFTTIRRLVDQDRTVVLITHKLDEVLRYADWVTVMRAGTVAANFPNGLVGREEINRLMVGEAGADGEKGGRGEGGMEGPVSPSPHLPISPSSEREPVLVVEALAAGDPDDRNSLRGVDLTAYGGEVLAVAGVAGNGQTLLAEAITGGVAHYRGRISIGGRDIAGLSRREVARLGIGYVPENRKEVGLIMGQSVAVNLALRAYDRPPYSRGGWVDYRAIRADGERLIQRYRIRTPSPDTPVGRLSGGNQQRVIVARELSGRPKLVVVDNFTRGLDPRSTEQFKQEVFAHRDGGAAVVWITSDLGEALECDRVAVVQRGRIVGVMPRAEATREKIGLLMTGDEAGEMGAEAAPGIRTQ